MAAAIERAGGGQKALQQVVRKATGRAVGQTTISDWANKGNPSAAMMFVIARALDLSLDEYARPVTPDLGAEVEQNARDIAWLTGRLQELAVRTGHTDLLGPEQTPEEPAAEQPA